MKKVLFIFYDALLHETWRQNLKTYSSSASSASSVSGSKPEFIKPELSPDPILAHKLIRTLLVLETKGLEFVLLFPEKPGYVEPIQSYLPNLLANEGLNFKILKLREFIQLGNAGSEKNAFLTENFDSEKSYAVASKESASEIQAAAVALQLQTFVLDAAAGKNNAGEFFTSWPRLSSFLLSKLRSVYVHRKTKETDIKLSLNLDGSGKSSIDTGLHFFNHMLENMSKHAKIDRNLIVKGHLHVDEHHSIEDVAIVLGEAVHKALADKKGIGRYCFALPMDESDAYCLLDLAGRFSFLWEASLKREYVGDFPTEMLRHFYESFASTARVNLHLKLRGENEHHKIEASFKAFAKCLHQAARVEGDDLPSTKGQL